MLTRKTQFKDALDYIFIANDSGPDSYLISSDIGAANRVTSAISATAATSPAAAAAAAGGGTNVAATVAIMGGPITTTITTTAASTSASTAAAFAAAATSTSLSLAADVNAAMMAADNLYGSVAVGLGAMLINDTLVLDTNGTGIGNGNGSLFDDFVNGTDLLMVNGTGNATATEDLAELIKMAATSVVLGLMILITIIGNVFVIAAIILERNLQNVANYLVASLAVADLFVACLVMPLGAVYEISEGWILGPELCDIWTSCDVLCCTASILHLVAIAVDRYWAVTNIDYMHSRTSKRVFMMIFCVWSASVIVSLAPQFGWKDPDYLQRIEQQKCMVSQDVAYQVFATCCTFYVPLLVILVLYWKIYQTARKRIHRRRPRPIDVTGNNNQPDLAAQKKHKRLRLRISKFSGEKRSKTRTTLGLVEGNSTNTVNTVEDTEFSSSNVDNKSRAGIEVTTNFSNTEETLATSTTTNQIATVSHLVALANQQHTASSTAANAKPQHIPTPAAAAADTDTAKAETGDIKQAIKSRPLNTGHKVCIVAPTNGDCDDSDTEIVAIPLPATTANGVGTEVLEDPQLQEQLQQVQQQNATKMPTGGTTTSNATTITSISAISPQTPTMLVPGEGGAAISTSPTSNTLACAQTPQLCGSGNASSQVTPVPKPKHQQQLSSISNPVYKVTKRKETLEAKRERKAAKTLAIITGAFVVCWLPFFVMALMLPLCAACEINDSIASLFLWLGYFNSTLNPVIYTIFSPEFRQAFKRILFGGHRPVHYRSGKM